MEAELSCKRPRPSGEDKGDQKTDQNAHKTDREICLELITLCYPSLEIFAHRTPRIYFKQAHCPIFSRQMNYREAHACVSGRLIPQGLLKQGISSTALFPPPNKSSFHTTSRQRLHKQTDGEGDGERASVSRQHFTHSARCYAGRKKNCTRIPMAGLNS